MIIPSVFHCAEAGSNNLSKMKVDITTFFILAVSLEKFIKKTQIKQTQKSKKKINAQWNRCQIFRAVKTQKHREISLINRLRGSLTLHMHAF